MNHLSFRRNFYATVICEFFEIFPKLKAFLRHRLPIGMCYCRPRRRIAFGNRERAKNRPIKRRNCQFMNRFFVVPYQTVAWHIPSPRGDWWHKTVGSSLVEQVNNPWIPFFLSLTDYSQLKVHTLSPECHGNWISCRPFSTVGWHLVELK